MYVEIDNYDALEMLMDRVRHWEDDYEIIELYEQMYERMIDEGCFNGGEFNVMSIVDNDIVNWCSVISEGDDEYEEVKSAWEDTGFMLDWGSIEAESDGVFLVRNF